MTGRRVAGIDALRGLVMLLMLVDHVRETVYLHAQVGDPVDVTTTTPGLFLTRSLSHICAPVFIALTGLGAWFHGSTHTRRETSVFLLERGAFLVLLELTVVGFAWTAEFPPSRLFLQVIWCIGICMIALAGLLHLGRGWQIAVGLVLVAGHNLLDGVVLTGESPFFVPWAILHQRDIIELGAGVTARTSYPVLPWIGVIALGYALGPWFARLRAEGTTVRRLLTLGAALLAGFVAIRWLNVYGDAPWFVAPDALTTLMSFLSLTKYPPSLLFLLATLGAGAVLLALFEATEDRRITAAIATFGAAPMFLLRPPSVRAEGGLPRRLRPVRAESGRVPERAEPGSSVAPGRRARGAALFSDPWIRPLEAETQGSRLATLLLRRAGRNAAVNLTGTRNGQWLTTRRSG